MPSALKAHKWHWLVCLSVCLCLCLYVLVEEQGVDLAGGGKMEERLNTLGRRACQMEEVMYEGEK